MAQSTPPAPRAHARVRWPAGAGGGGARGRSCVFPLPFFHSVQLWRASCGHPNHGAISQMVKINGRQSASPEFHTSAARNEIACEGAAWTGRAKRSSAPTCRWPVVCCCARFRPDFQSRSCLCVRGVAARRRLGGRLRTRHCGARRNARRAAADAAPERASVAGTRARDARAWVGVGV